MSLWKRLLSILAGVQLAMSAQAATLLIVTDEPETIVPLAEHLQQVAGYDVQTVDEKDLPQDLSSHAGVFMYIHGLMTGKTAGTLIAYAKGGGHLIVLHHGISSKKAQTPEWLNFLGIYLETDKASEQRYTWLKDATYDLVNLQPKHEVTSKGVKYPENVEYSSSDRPSVPGTFPAIRFHESEIFINHQFTDGREKTVLFGCRYEDTKTGQVLMQDRYGWMKPAKKGWVFYFQPGHRLEDFRNAAYQQVLKNALKWER